MKVIDKFCNTLDTTVLNELTPETALLFKKLAQIAKKYYTNKNIANLVLEYYTTKVVNVKVAYLRPKYKNLQEWEADPKNVYIGRRGIVFINGERYPKKDSIWANPFKISKEMDRNQVIAAYDKYIRQKIIKENLKEQLLNLSGKNLGCWCHPEPCHGDILVKLIEEL